MKILSWNLKNWPSMNGVPTLEDKEAIDQEVRDHIQALENSNPLEKSTENSLLVDFQRAEKLLSILIAMSELPDIIFFQEVTSKNFIDWIAGQINKNKGSEIYKNVAHYNEPEVSQGLSILSKYDIGEVQKINVSSWLAATSTSNKNSLLTEGIEGFESFIKDKPELQVAIGGFPAWNTVINQGASQMSGLRPVLAVRLKIDDYDVWCLNVHLKSNLPMWGAFGLGKSDGHDDIRKKMASALNKGIREAYAHAIVGFTKKIEVSESVAKKEKKSSFIVAGDFNTVENLDKENILFKDDATINIIKNSGYTKAQNNNITFNNLEDSTKSWDIDHVFVKGGSDSYLKGKAPGNVNIIDVTQDENKVRYEVINDSFKSTIQKGKYYVISKDLLVKPGGLSTFAETSLFLAIDSMSVTSTSAVLKVGATIKAGPDKVFIVDSASSNNTSARTVFISSTDGNIVFSVKEELKIKRVGGDKAVGTASTFLGENHGSSFTVDNQGSFEGGIKTLPKKFEFDASKWSPVYKVWSRRKFWEHYKIVINDIVYSCIEAHTPSATDNFFANESASTLSEYGKRYWTRIGPVGLGILTDHNGVLVVI